MKILVFYVNAHQKMTSAEEFNSQVNRIIHSMGNQLLFLAIPVIDEWTHEQSDYSVRDGLDNILLTNLTWLQLLLSSR